MNDIRTATNIFNKFYIIPLFIIFKIKLKHIINNKVIKWTKPVRLYVAGNYNERDIQLIDLLCKEINKVTGFPGIKRIEETNRNTEFLEVLADFDKKELING